MYPQFDITKGVDKLPTGILCRSVGMSSVFFENLERAIIFSLRCDAIGFECLLYGTSWKDKHPITLEQLDYE